MKQIFTQGEKLLKENKNSLLKNIKRKEDIKKVKRILIPMLKIA
jgi:hypothetical protein